MTWFVLDASVALSWIFQDEYSAYAESISEIMNRGQAIVPVVWPLEIANALLLATRRGSLEPNEAPMLIGDLNTLRIDVDQSISRESLAMATLTIGMLHRVSAYDASYLELAMRRGLPLATLDDRLATAADAAGIAILQP